MTDQTQTPTTPAAPAAEAKPTRTPLVKQNGVSRPGQGKTLRVWEIADELSAAAGKPAARKDVLAKGQAEGINVATLATQYGRWRRFHGLAKEAKPAATPTAEAAPAAAPAPSSDVTVEQK